MKTYFLSAIIVLGSFFSFPNSSFSQLKTYQFEQIDSLQKIEKRNVIVFIQTDWCKYCQVLKNTTFKNDSIIHVINSKFYLIQLNGEEKREIFFNGNNFKFKPTGNNTGTHELAEQLATFDDKITYPTICFLNWENEIIFQHNQFINSIDLLNVLKRLE